MSGIDQGHFMTFRKFGRSYQLRIASHRDLPHVLELDDAHWVATGAPIDSLNLDPLFLDSLDSDNNGRLMCFEVRDGIRWISGRLNDLASIDTGSTVLELDTLNPDDDQGRRVGLASRKMLRELGRKDEGRITLEQVRAIKRRAEETPVSEAGVVLPEAAADEDDRRFLADIVATVGGVPHPGGRPGIDTATLEAFLEQARARVEWLACAGLGGQAATAIMPLGDRTSEAHACLRGLRAKLEQFFAQCEAVALDPRAGNHFLPADAEWAGLDMQDPEAIGSLLERAPLAPPNACGELALDSGLNPFYVDKLRDFCVSVLGPVIGAAPATLGRPEWDRIKQVFAAHDEWLDSEAGAALEPLGTDRLALCLDPARERSARSLIAESSETSLVMDNVRLTEKVILYQANILKLLTNFVSFPHLYDPASRAVFEMGTLTIDGRHLNFSVRVIDHEQHFKAAGTSDICIVYVQVAPCDAAAFEIALPVTSGGKGNLCIGKRGVFSDIQGRQHDARVVQIVDNPISIREAVVAPFQRVGRMLTGKLEAITAAAEKNLDADTTAALSSDSSVQPASRQPNRGMLAGGLVMGGGVALAALGSSLAYITSTLSELNPWVIAAGILGAVLAVIAPASVMALLKLRRRDLSAILEGCGWAINARMRLTFRQGRMFTHRPRVPGIGGGFGPGWVWVVIVSAIAVAALLIATQLLQP